MTLSHSLTLVVLLLSNLCLAGTCLQDLDGIPLRGEKVPFYNLIANGYPWGSKPIKRRIDQMDQYLWELSRKSEWNEAGSWELLDADGRVLESAIVQPAKYGTFDEEILNKSLQNIFLQFKERYGEDHRRASLLRFRHTHPPDSEGTPFKFSAGDRLFMMSLRNQFNLESKFKHLDMEAQIIYSNGQSLSKKTFVLHQGRWNYWIYPRVFSIFYLFF